MDITPAVPEGKQIIEAYGDGRFRINGIHHQGSVLIFPDETLSWRVDDIEALTKDSLEVVIERASMVDVLLLGCGRKMTMISPGLRSELRAAGIVVEPMDTGAACRTYNVLLSEGRQVAAALIAVS